MTEAVRIRAKFRGTSRGCKKPIHTGDDIVWQRGLGAYHIECYPKAVPNHPQNDYVHDRRPQGPSPRRMLSEQEQAAIKTGICEVCLTGDVVIIPVVLRATRRAVMTCEGCLEDMAAAARRA